MNRKLLTALRALVSQITSGPNEARLEVVIDREINNVIIALSDELGGGQRRSEAARVLLRRGAQGMLDDAQVSA